MRLKRESFSGVNTVAPERQLHERRGSPGERGRGYSKAGRSFFDGCPKEGSVGPEYGRRAA